MFVDIKEITRNKICLREYTGGGFLPTAKGYACAGYDAVALTQKGVYTPEAENILRVYVNVRVGAPRNGADVVIVGQLSLHNSVKKCS